jgi:hypothetical protein
VLSSLGPRDRSKQRSCRRHCALAHEPNTSRALRWRSATCPIRRRRPRGSQGLPASRLEDVGDRADGAVPGERELRHESVQVVVAAKLGRGGAPPPARRGIPSPMMANSGPASALSACRTAGLSVIADGGSWPPALGVAKLLLSHASTHALANSTAPVTPRLGRWIVAVSSNPTRSETGDGRCPTVVRPGSWNRIDEGSQPALAGTVASHLTSKWRHVRLCSSPGTHPLNP